MKWQIKFKTDNYEAVDMWGKILLVKNSASVLDGHANSPVEYPPFDSAQYFLEESGSLKYDGFSLTAL